MKAKLAARIKASGDFASDELRLKYLDLIQEADFIIRADIDAGTPALANFDDQTITLYEEFFVREYIPMSNGVRRYEPLSRVKGRMLDTLAHEIRHLAPANNALSTDRTAARALIDSDYHDRAPFETDANEFRDILLNRSNGVIDDF